MNLDRNAHNFNRSALPWSGDAYRRYRNNNMHPVISSMSSPPYDGRQTDERIVSGSTSHQSGDAIIVQPSFDESMERSKTPVASSPSLKSHPDWQTRSPNEDGKQGDIEPRNPSSPGGKGSMSSRHERQLSAHFFDATTLTPRDPSLDPTMESVSEDKYAGRKHRRMLSGDVTNPALAHRRINSIGNTAMIQRGSAGSNHHHRVDSAGLDILSTAASADLSKEELSAAAGPRSSGEGATRLSPSYHAERSPPNPPMLQSHDVPQGHHPNMLPPDHHHHRRRSSQSSYPSAGYGPPPPHVRPPYPGHHPHYPPAPTHPNMYYAQPPPGAYHGRPMHHHAPPPAHGYPVQYAQRPPPTMYDQKKQEASPSQWNSVSHTQGSQTFVTAMAVGQGTRTVHPTSMPVHEEADKSGHHRKLSSLSSLGHIFGSNIFSSQDGTGSAHPLKMQAHHRTTSSNISFLPGIEVGLDNSVDLESTDEAFMRNLHAANSAAAAAPVMSGASAESTSEKESSPRPRVKLAAGGTSKRVRRKCTVDGCQNRVVQGGLCIAHGAKRKTCKHPGCTKNVKKAGLCSTHGPARKRCEADGCAKVAVQGGRCISHGAKKRMCSVGDCSKQAIIGGMCKKHHDMNAVGVCKEVTTSKPTHQRGLSIFQEVSAETVGNILLDETGSNSGESPHEQQRQGSW